MALGYSVNLTELRKEKKLTVCELARQVGTTEASISRYETGSRKLPVEMAKKIAEVLKVKWWKLYE